MIGIIGAMDVEVNAILEKMQIVKKENKFETIFYMGRIAGKNVILCKSGVGKVNASITATMMNFYYQPDALINIGTAGGMLKEQNTLDIVISDKIIQHDFDTSAVDGDEGIGLISKSDDKLRIKVKKAFENIKNESEIYFGDIISGDLFVAEDDKVLKLKEKFPTAIACEMEAGAIAQTCERFETPFIVIRSLSDIVFHDNSGIDYRKNLELTSKRSADMVEEFLGME